ncbi:Hypothetical predicted protein [Pelobates cultripes]|uniref:Uncharacterized protein n=1 Tax=Pelobates cultripes TaxID=61616 RepID=A0AAD1TDK5_PELCU|nr:Hypothetical predicted protein [Pelobates cultripes]
MAAAPTNHMSCWEIRFQMAFDALCTAFWTWIESRQQQAALSYTKPTETLNVAPSPCAFRRLWAERNKNPLQPAPVIKRPYRAPAQRQAPRRRPRRPSLPARTSQTQAAKHSPAPQRHSMTAARRACNNGRWLTATGDTTCDGPDSTDHLPQPGLRAKGIG